MTRTYKIVKGSTEVDLINTSTIGIILSRGGGPKPNYRPDLSFSRSSLADSGNLRLRTTPPVTERYTINVKDDVQDDAAAQLQALGRILLDAENNGLTQWQTSPVYIQRQATNETNTEYARVIAWNQQILDDIFNQPFENDAEFDDIEIVITREPFWSSQPPETLPSLEPIFYPDNPYFDSETIGTGGALSVTSAAAQTGDWGGSVTLAGVGSETYWSDLSPNNETEFSLQFEINGDDLAMTSSDAFNNLVANGSGTGGVTFRLVYTDAAGTRGVQLRVVDDAGAVVDATSFYNLIAGKNTILIEWKAATAPAADDGEGKLTINGVLKETLSGIDNDTHDVDDYDWGGFSSLDAGTSGDLYGDNFQWDDASPFVAAVRTIDFENKTAFIANHRDSTELSHIYNEDNGTGFSANLIAEPSFDYFIVSGSTPVVNDAVYFGADSPFFQVALRFGTGGAASSATVVLEYSQGGSAWATVAGGIDSDRWFDGSVGHQAICFSGEADWAVDTVNGVGSKFWLRARISAISGYSAAPAQLNEIVHNVKDTYYQVNETQIHGDVGANILQSYIEYSADINNVSTFMILGAKSRGLTNFLSHFNAGGDNPAAWATAYFTDTSQVADPTAPGGNSATCTFATQVALVRRLTFTTTDQDVISDFSGSYRFYARVKQELGDIGSVSLQLGIKREVTDQGEQVSLKSRSVVISDNNILVDLGLFNLEIENKGNESTFANLTFEIFAASSDGATPDLHILDLIPIPVDEFSMIASSSLRGQQWITTGDGLYIDSGILRKGSIQTNIDSYALSGNDDVIGIQTTSPWQTRGLLPLLQPRRKTNIYFILADRSSDGNDIEAVMGTGGGIQLYAVERWLSLRGSD